jgi:hypothetical protein
VVAVEHASDFLSRLRLQTDEGIHLIFFFADDLRRGIEGDARIALDIDHTRDLDVGRALERIAIAAQAVLHIVLVGHGEIRQRCPCPSTPAPGAGLRSRLPDSCWCR